VLTDVIIRITFLTFLRVAANWSFIAMVQRTNSTAPASGSLGLEPRLPPARDHAGNTDYSDRLSARRPTNRVRSIVSLRSRLT
jgi:hypothetical protein